MFSAPDASSGVRPNRIDDDVRCQTCARANVCEATADVPTSNYIAVSFALPGVAVHRTAHDPRRLPPFRLVADQPKETPVASNKRERQRLNKIAGSPFRIVVCAYPDRTITPVVPLLKGALLYGDEVVLHSPMASMLGAVAAIAHNDQQTFMRFALEVGPTISDEFREQLASLDAALGSGQGRKILEALFDPHSLSRVVLSKLAPEFREQIAKFERDQLPGIRQQLIDVSAQQIADAGFGDLDAAFDAGCCESVRSTSPQTTLTGRILPSFSRCSATRRATRYSTTR